MITDITITYNNRNGLDRTLNSLAMQTCNDFEVIVIDGGSTDGSMDVMLSYAEVFSKKGVSYMYVSEEDKGRYDAMNKGIVRGNGEWMMFLNAGDTLSSDDVMHRLLEFVKCTDSEIVYGDNNRIYDNGVVEYHRANSLELIKKGMPFCHQSTLTRSDLFKKRLYNDRFVIAGDYEWFVGAYLNNCKFEYIPFCISDFYIDGISCCNRYKTYTEALEIRKKYNIEDSIIKRNLKRIIWLVIDVFNISQRFVSKFTP